MCARRKLRLRDGCAPASLFAFLKVRYEVPSENFRRIATRCDRFANRLPRLPQISYWSLGRTLRLLGSQAFAEAVIVWLLQDSYRGRGFFPAINIFVFYCWSCILSLLLVCKILLSTVIEANVGFLSVSNIYSSNNYTLLIRSTGCL